MILNTWYRENRCSCPSRQLTTKGNSCQHYTLKTVDFNCQCSFMCLLYLHGEMFCDFLIEKCLMLITYMLITRWPIICKEFPSAPCRRKITQSQFLNPAIYPLNGYSGVWFSEGFVSHSSIDRVSSGLFTVVFQIIYGLLYCIVYFSYKRIWLISKRNLNTAYWSAVI